MRNAADEQSISYSNDLIWKRDGTYTTERQNFLNGIKGTIGAFLDDMEELANNKTKAKTEHVENERFQLLGSIYISASSLGLGDKERIITMLSGNRRIEQAMRQNLLGGQTGEASGQPGGSQ